MKNKSYLKHIFIVILIIACALMIRNSIYKRNEYAMKEYVYKLYNSNDKNHDMHISSIDNIECKAYKTSFRISSVNKYRIHNSSNYGECYVKLNNHTTKIILDKNDDFSINSISIL